MFSFQASSLYLKCYIFHSFKVLHAFEKECQSKKNKQKAAAPQLQEQRSPHPEVTYGL